MDQTDIERRLAALEQFKRECDRLFRLVPVMVMIVAAGFLARYWLY